MLDIRPATNSEQIETVRTLFTEYAESLGFSLCFQGFDKELAELPGAYVAPRGRVLLATVNRETAGCVALRPIPDGVCELLRIFVRRADRSSRNGRAWSRRR